MSISNPPLVGSPDWQRGFISAQKLLATVPANTASEAVTMPPNAETIVVIAGAITPGNQCFCVGATTGKIYPGAIATGSAVAGGHSAVMFDATPVIDETVTITWITAPITTWYIAADAGIRIVSDIGKLTNTIGVQYVIPTTPGTGAGDHPPVELKYASAAGGSGTVVLAAAGAGNRYRIFSAQMSSWSAAAKGELDDSTSTRFFASSSVMDGFGLAYPLTGIALPTNSGVTMVLSAGTATAVVTYTLETV